MRKTAIVLVAGSGNVTGMNIIRALNKKYKVLGCDFKRENAANLFCENFVISPCASTMYESELLAIIRENKITHVIASNDHDVRAIAKLYPYLEREGVFFNGYGIHTLDLLNKSKTYELFKNNDILTPERLSESSSLPMVLRKKEMGKTKKFLHIIKSQEDWANISEEEKQGGLYTRYIPGEEYTIDVLCSSDSTLMVAIPRLRIKVENGMVIHAKIVHDDKLIEIVRGIVATLKLKGMNCIQCIKFKDKYYFIEINPRPGSGMDLSIHANINMPFLWIEETEGKSFSIPEPDWGLKLLRFFDGYYFK